MCVAHGLPEFQESITNTALTADQEGKGETGPGHLSSN